MSARQSAQTHGVWRHLAKLFPSEGGAPCLAGRSPACLWGPGKCGRSLPWLGRLPRGRSLKQPLAERSAACRGYRSRRKTPGGANRVLLTRLEAASFTGMIISFRASPVARECFVSSAPSRNRSKRSPRGIWWILPSGLDGRRCTPNTAGRRIAGCAVVGLVAGSQAGWMERSFCCTAWAGRAVRWRHSLRGSMRQGIRPET